MAEPRYKRVLLKLSGEALEGDGRTIDPDILDAVAREVIAARELGTQVAIVIGGGNLFRGLAGAASGMSRTVADGMGMLATVMNCLAMADTLVRAGCPASVLSAIAVHQVADAFTARDALARLDGGQVVLLAAGTGNPYFTTDTAAALRALEVEADVLLKATKVDGIYDKDPVKHSDAKRFDEITYAEILQRQLKVMDLTAVTLCRDNKLPLLVFDMNTEGNIRRVIAGETVGTRVIEA
ncbi:MAG: UMP kinase [Myxococcales bacterium]|nr:UMP kinase [Myxococcales bacterium]